MSHTVTTPGLLIPRPVAVLGVEGLRLLLVMEAAVPQC
jgi:hypothetical protein